MQKIKLMTDYNCHPLWWYDSEKVGNINPEMLPLSPEIIARLHAFAEAKDARLDWDYPPNTPPLTAAEIEMIEQEGVSLWQELKSELKSQYEVVYFSEKLLRVIHSPSELMPKELASV